jgi:excisionase family DNA binding protein
MADDSFLTVAEVAADLRCSPATVKRAIAGGRLAAVAVGERTVRVPVAEYLRFVGRSAAGEAGEAA